MNTRLALYGWIARHGLDRQRGEALFDLAGLKQQPPSVARRLWPAVAIAGAALAGFGVILWLAANWGGLGRMGRFTLLQAALLVFVVGAAARTTARPPLALLALLCTGGLFAYFGQTYQTGADPWQLFALWAVLGLPLCFATRSDVLWAPWALVVAAAIALWAHAHAGHSWSVEARDLGVHVAAWSAGALLAMALSPAAARFTGAGAWASRTAVALVVIMVTATALRGLLFTRDVAPHYWLALALMAIAIAALCSTSWFDVFMLSAATLALDVLLVAGAARALFDGHRGDPIGRLLVLGLLAAGLLAASVSLVMRLARRHHG